MIHYGRKVGKSASAQASKCVTVFVSRTVLARLDQESHEPKLGGAAAQVLLDVVPDHGNVCGGSGDGGGGGGGSGGGEAHVLDGEFEECLLGLRT